MLDQPSFSKLHPYSLGLVSANKPLNSSVIEVTPFEDFPMLNGEITDNIEKYKSTINDAVGSTKQTEVKTTASVRAKWLPISNSNRKTPPDVRRGETVMIYRFGDTDQYWWNTIFNDIKLRRLETVIYAFSNNREENIDDTSESTYFLEISTHTKTVHFHTSKNDGEPFAYDIQINAKEGIITITDDAENFIVLNSRDKRITAHNGDESMVDIDKTNINITCKETLTMNCKDLRVNSTNSTLNTSDGMTIESGTNTVKGPTNFTDLATFESGFNSSNGGGTAGTMTGGLNVDGDVSVTNLSASSSVTAPNIQ